MRLDWRIALLFTRGSGLSNDFANVTAFGTPSESPVRYSCECGLARLIAGPSDARTPLNVSSPKERGKLTGDPRPSVWIGHVVLETSRLAETEQFMLEVGMRSVVHGDDVAVLELRGGTHLVLIANPAALATHAPFDLMVEDLEATHQRFIELGLNPGAIEATPPNHRTFTIQEPSGHVVTFFSNHVSGQPV